MWGIPRPVIAAGIGAVVACVSLFLIVKYHPFMNLPQDVRDILASVWTGLLSIGGGMAEHWRIERKARKLAAEIEADG